MGNFSNSFCIKVIKGHCFLEKPGLTPAYGLRRAKVGFGTDGRFSIYVCGLGDVRAVFFTYAT